MGKGYERWHCGAGREPGLMVRLYQGHLHADPEFRSYEPGAATVDRRATLWPTGFSEPTGVDLVFEADRAGKGRRADAHPLLASLSPPVRRTRGGQMKTQREKAEEQRQAKLDEIREQVEGGTLVIRPMTPAERSQYPPRPVERKRQDRR
jgi:hypothetical protein